MSLPGIIISVLVVIFCLIYVCGSLIKIGMDLRKFETLDTSAQNKLLLIKYYMVAVRKLKREELIKLSELTEEELKQIDKIEDYDERVKAMKESKGNMLAKNGAKRHSETKNRGKDSNIGVKSFKIGVRNTEIGAKSTGHGVPNSENRVKSTKIGVQNSDI